MDKTVIADSDALIALLSEDDLHHAEAVEILEKLINDEYRILYPATAIVETTTIFQRKFSKPELAAEIVKMIGEAQLPIEPVDGETITEASKLFDPKGSKQNALFDAVVAALTKRVDAEAVFGFDEWYRKIGLQIAVDLF
jgi:predicted nucleic acid-binding protein